MLDWLQKRLRNTILSPTVGFHEGRGGTVKKFILFVYSEARPTGCPMACSMEVMRSEWEKNVSFSELRYLRPLGAEPRESPLMQDATRHQIRIR